MERPMWIRFKRGDHLETSELREMRKQISAAVPLLRYHPDGGAMLRVAMMDLGKIEMDLAGRKGNP